MSRHIGGNVQNVGDDRLGGRQIGEPIAVDPNPSKPVRRKLRIGARIADPARRTGADYLDGRVISFDQAASSVRADWTVRAGSQVATNSADILVVGRRGNINRQGSAGRPRGQPSACYWLVRLIPFEIREQSTRRRLGFVRVTNLAGGEIADGGVKRFNDPLRGRAANLIGHIFQSAFPAEMATASYHVQLQDAYRPTVRSSSVRSPSRSRDECTVELSTLALLN